MLRLALTPRWITALLGCIALGVIFAMLAQWQASRSFIPSTPGSYSKIVYRSIDQVVQPNQPYTFQELEPKTRVLTEVVAKVKLNPEQAVLIGNRLQPDGTKGSWIVVPADTTTARLFIAVSFIPETEDAQDVLTETKQIATTKKFIKLFGRYLPSEAPLQQVQKDSFDSLSVAQLVNIVATKGTAYTGFLALTGQSQFSQLAGVEIPKIDLAKGDSGLNWLTTFYALEWTFFAVFALFIWWRLLADAFRKQQLEILGSQK